MAAFIDTLELPQTEKDRLRAMTPGSYMAWPPRWRAGRADQPGGAMTPAFRFEPLRDEDSEVLLALPTASTGVAVSSLMASQHGNSTTGAHHRS